MLFRSSQTNEGIFLGYSSTSKAYRVYNKRTMKVMETVNVVIDESSESGEVDISAESSKTLGVPGVLRDMSSCSTISGTSFGLGGRISLGNSSLAFVRTRI